jgi:DNA-binding MarR family transcriptional regulator
MHSENHKNKTTEALKDIIDHLVDAVGDPSVHLSRVMTLIDIDAHQGTTQSQIMQRLNYDKALVNRHIDWLSNYGCITKSVSTEDAREYHLRVSAYSKKHLDLALARINYSHKHLQNLIETIINTFDTHRPTLRDAKVLTTVGALDGAKMTKNEILKNLYNGPFSTDSRSLQILIEENLIDKNEN